MWFGFNRCWSANYPDVKLQKKLPVGQIARASSRDEGGADLLGSFSTSRPFPPNPSQAFLPLPWRQLSPEPFRRAICQRAQGMAARSGWRGISWSLLQFARQVDAAGAFADAEVRITVQDSAWYEIRLPDGQTGWMSNQELVKL